LVGVRHTKYWSVAFCPKQCVFSDAVVVFSCCTFGSFAVIQSSLHQAWAWEYSGSLKRDLRYSPSDCFENFAFPLSHQNASLSGRAFHDQRKAVMARRFEGLTATYNHFHDPDEAAADIQKLRDLHVMMDKAVTAAYGWDDLKLDHGFHQTKQGLRFTISEPARREVLARLLKLNHERYAEEVAKGLHEKGKGKGGAKGKRIKGAEVEDDGLFGGGE
ncbi:MAG: type IIL restriction-modification enzyme MmeI, partial [Phycisphaerae bacterium]